MQLPWGTLFSIRVGKGMQGKERCTDLCENEDLFTIITWFQHVLPENYFQYDHRVKPTLDTLSIVCLNFIECLQYTLCWGRSTTNHWNLGGCWQVGFSFCYSAQAGSFFNPQPAIAFFVVLRSTLMAFSGLVHRSQSPWAPLWWSWLQAFCSLLQPQPSSLSSQPQLRPGPEDQLRFKAP